MLRGIVERGGNKGGGVLHFSTRLSIARWEIEVTLRPFLPR